jgi:hypothetical protein
MGSVSVLVPRLERPAVRAKTHRLVHQLAHQPGGGSRLHRRVCLQVTAIAPDLPVDRLALLVRHAMWSYLIDDRLEAGDAATQARLRDGVAAVTTGRLTRPSDPLLAELAGTVAMLSRYDGGGELLVWFGEVLRDAVAADVTQLRLARAVACGTRPLPTVERYLETAARTVNYQSFAYLLLAVSAGGLTGPQLACVNAALWQAAYAVRLGNDLRSAGRDSTPETSLNILRLRTAAGAPVTERYVRDEIDRRVRAHDSGLRALTGLGVIAEPPARVLIRCLSQSISLYLSTDLR